MIVLQLLNGLTFAALLFVVASGSQRVAVLEIRSGDLPETAGLFAQLPGHQEDLSWADFAEYTPTGAAAMIERG
jgi:hypothetical protein